MEIWEQELIKNTFKRCFGLHNSIKKGTIGSLEELSYQCSIRLDYLKKNLNEIINLVD